jgi:carboxyl-terminal processing protease
MKRQTFWRAFFLVLSYLAVAAVAATCAVFVLLFAMAGEENKLQELERVIRERFIDEVDTVAIEDAAAAAMVDALGNRWSYYIPAAEYADHVANQENAYVGIGITISPLADNKGLEILRVEPGSGALDAGLQPGDVVIAVNGQGMDVLSVDNAKTLVQGEPGTTVEITVLRNGKEQNFTVERRYIQLEVATGELLNGNVGYIKINNFNSRCAQETIALIEKLQAEGATSLLFDVRFNPGGYRTRW